MNEEIYAAMRFLQESGGDIEEEDYLVSLLDVPSPPPNSKKRPREEEEIREPIPYLNTVIVREQPRKRPTSIARIRELTLEAASGLVGEFLNPNTPTEEIHAMLRSRRQLFCIQFVSGNPTGRKTGFLCLGNPRVYSRGVSKDGTPSLAFDAMVTRFTFLEHTLTGITRVAQEGGDASFAVLTEIPELDDILRDQGFHTDPDDAVEAACSLYLGKYPPVKARPFKHAPIKKAYVARATLKDGTCIVKYRPSGYCAFPINQQRVIQEVLQSTNKE